MNERADIPLTPFPVLPAMAALIGFTVPLAAGAAWLLHWLDQPTHSTANLTAAGICLLAGLLGLLPVYGLSRRLPHGAAMGFMVSILVRLAICGAAVVVARFSGYAHAQALAYWIAGWYLLLLMVEVAIIGRYVARHARMTPHPANPTPNAPGLNTENAV